MRYKLDSNGYICAVSFGCYLEDCMEYTGNVPMGYNSLDDWASHSCIQAYYIDSKGNLALDYARKVECENKQTQEAIDHTPILRKDLYETDEVLCEQYLRETVTGKVIVLEDIKAISPKVKITGVQPYEYNVFSIYTHGKNMLPCNAASKNVSGVTFTKNISGSISILGTATEDIEYIVADGEATPVFALKENHDYYLNLGGMRCELRNYNGETTAQQYVGASGLINLPESIEVSQVVIKISEGETVNTTFYPQLEYGNEFTGYDPHKCKIQEIDISELWGDVVYPKDTLYAKDTLYPGIFNNVVDYILIENGKVIVSLNEEVYVLTNGNVGVFGDYSTIYATKDVELEVEYSTTTIDVNSLEFLQGKATTTNQFKILEDGSIEAHNGYFSGEIEADSGYFKGDITGGSININERFKVDVLGNVTLPDNAMISWGQVTDANAEVTKITKNTVTASYIEATAGLSAKYATIGSLDAAIGRISTIESNYISASTVKADYMEVKNWTSGGYIKAEKIDVNSLAARFTQATVLNVGLLSTGNLRVGIYEFKPQYNSTLGCYILQGTQYSS